MRTRLRTRPLIRRLAQAVLHRYPRAWRERYEEEVRTLLRDVPPGWRDVCELFRGLIVERVRELLSNDEQPGRTAALLRFLNPAFAVVLVAAAALLGYGLRGALGDWTPLSKEIFGWSLVVLLPVTLVFLFRARKRPYDFSAPPYPAWVGVTFLLGLCAAITLVFWGRPFESDYQSAFLPDEVRVSYNWVLVILFASDLASSVIPTHKMLASFGTIRFAELQIASNLKLADSCREWIAKGVPSPLDQAEQEVVRWTRIRDEAMAQVRALGYRTRFERGWPAVSAIRS